MDWVDYWQLEPFGDDWRQSATISWAASLSAHLRRRLSVDTFMPAKPKPEPKAVAAKLDGFFKAMVKHGQHNHRKHDRRRKGDSGGVHK